MVKKDILYRILIYILMLSAILMPWLTDAKYNQDLLVMVVYLKEVFGGTTLLESFQDNTTFIYVMRTLFPEVSPYNLIYVLHNISVVVLTFTLKRYLRPIYVCAIMFFCFFTIFCNQFRLAYSLSIGIIGFMTYFKNKKKGIFLIILSAFFHFFVAFFMMCIFLVDIFNRSKGVYKFLIINVVVGVLVGMGYFVLSNPRFLLYLNQEDEGFVSNTFVLITFALLIIWKSIDRNKRKFVLLIYIVVVITSVLPSLSSRLGELLFVVMLLLSKDALIIRYKEIWNATFLKPYRAVLYFLVGFVFFSYRFTNWVILGKVIRPDILDYL